MSKNKQLAAPTIEKTGKRLLLGADGSITKPGTEKKDPQARAEARTLWWMIQKKLQSKTSVGITKQEAIAEAFIEQGMIGSFAHAREIIERQDGKVPSKVSPESVPTIKLYMGMPLSDEEGSP